MFRTERSKRTGGTYFLDEELIRMIGNEFRSSGAYMRAQRWDYIETEHPQLKNILKYLYEKGTVFYRVANERREYSLKTGKKKQDSDGLLNTIRNLIRGVVHQENLGAHAVHQKLADIFNISHAREEVKPYLEKIINLIDAGKPLPDRAGGEDGHIHHNKTSANGYLRMSQK